MQQSDSKFRIQLKKHRTEQMKTKQPAKRGASVVAVEIVAAE